MRHHQPPRDVPVAPARRAAIPAARRLRRLLLAAAALGTLVACRRGTNYVELEGPRHAGAPVPARDRAATSPRADTLRVVSFNVEYAKHVDGAIAILESAPGLRDADVVLLQEMDAAATRRVAAALGMWYVYYPAILHQRTGRDFGNAVLSRWPIVSDAKLVLPHRSRYAGTQRTATAATVRAGEATVRVYSTHLGTPLDLNAAGRRDQLRAILADAAPHDRVVIGGDFNDAGVARVAVGAGYRWATARGPRTTILGRWDHVLMRGLPAPRRGGDAAGTGPHARGVSDHRPVWAAGLLR